MRGLEVGDPLAHRALEALLRAETSLRRSLSSELEREGVTAAGFSVLVVLTTAGGSIELRALRRRLEHDRRASAVDITRAGAGLAERLFPAHTERVSNAFGGLDEAEKRDLADLSEIDLDPRIGIFAGFVVHRCWVPLQGLVGWGDRLFRGYETASVKGCKNRLRVGSM